MIIHIKIYMYSIVLRFCIPGINFTTNRLRLQVVRTLYETNCKKINYIHNVYSD